MPTSGAAWPERAVRIAMRRGSRWGCGARGRVGWITLNRPELLNACNYDMHEELADVFVFALDDSHSDLVVLTGAGRAFSAGGDLQHITRSAENPELFDQEARCAKRVVFGMLDLDKPLICQLNGHAVGLGATIALLCDVIFANENAKIGDPHVNIGLVAGDGGAANWAQRIGLGRQGCPRLPQSGGGAEQRRGRGEAASGHQGSVHPAQRIPIMPAL